MILGMILFRKSQKYYIGAFEHWNKVLPLAQPVSPSHLRGSSHGVHCKVPICYMPKYLAFLTNKFISIGGKLEEQEVKSNEFSIPNHLTNLDKVSLTFNRKMIRKSSSIAVALGHVNWPTIRMFMLSQVK